MRNICKYAIIAFLLWLHTSASGQVQIQLQIVPGFNLRPADMFNADVLNAGGRPGRFYFTGTITDENSGKLVVEARTASIELGTGSERLNLDILAPTFRYYLAVAGQNSFLPFGRYEICLRAFQDAGNEEKGAACTEQESTPLSPPLLIYPENGSEIPTTLPLLVWLGPMPFNPQLPVLYDLKLVELAPNQTPYDAIHKNFALLDMHSLTQNQLEYPATAIALDPAKKYAWKVVARSTTGTIIGETEVWTFSLARPVEAAYQPPAPTTNYIRMKRDVTADYALITQELRAIYNKEYEVSGIEFRVLDMQQRLVAKVEAGEMKNEGNNRYVIGVSDLSRLKRNHFYLLEASLGARDKQFLLFKYVNQ